MFIEKFGTLKRIDMRRFRKIELLAATALLAALGVAAASASETVTYTYDAKGRVVKVEHSGSVNNNVVANYSYDTADNRTNVNVTGVP
jgi:coenzyme F420-reducing hydrogenase delta subunit